MKEGGREGTVMEDGRDERRKVRKGGRVTRSEGGREKKERVMECRSKAEKRGEGGRGMKR